MMTTKSMRYDHPAYTARTVGSVNFAAGASAAKGKYVAFTNMILKSATVTVTVAGTTTGAATTLTFNHISGTTTTSVGVAAMGTAAAFVNSTNVVLGGGTTTMAQGDIIQANRGADASLTGEIAYELVVVPGADVTD